nr:replication protein A 70 kDa DNA-binding subunit B-like [Ipomoea batatas]
MRTLETVSYQTGDAVEVASNDEGFVGSYYESTMVGQLTTGGLHLRRLRPDLCEGNVLRQWGGKVVRHQILVLNYVDIAGGQLTHHRRLVVGSHEAFIVACHLHRIANLMFLPVSVVSIATPSLLLDDNVEVLTCREVYDSYKFATLNSSKYLIGRVVSIHQPKDIQVKQNSQRFIDFVIEDCRESRLTVTLWDEHVDSVLPFFKGVLTDPLIVILQLCRARVTDDGEIRISSSYTATRVLFNYECLELFAFKDRFLTQIRSISSRSRNTRSGSLETMSNENITVTSLMDIYDDKKIEEFWVVGEISDIQRDWYFIACANKGCGKKLQEINDQMYCKSCDQQSPDEIIKYKLVIDILNDEQDRQLILWDNEGCMPNEIDGLIGKTMEFMIVTREDQFKYRGNDVFTVLGVQADEAIGNSFKKREQGSVIRKLAEEKEFNENFGQVCTI